MYRRAAPAITVLILLLSAALQSACGGASQAKGPARPPAMPVKIQVAELRPVGDFTEYVATLQSRNSSVLQADVEGQIVKIFVRAGEHVAAGAPLLLIDPNKQQAVVTNQEATERAQRAALELARVDLERKKKLFSEGVIARQDLDQSQSAYDSARAQVDAMQAGVRQQQVQLRYYTVHAPTAGAVGDIPVRVGDRVTVATVLTTLDSGGELEAYVEIPAEKAAAVKVGTPVEIVGDEPTSDVRSTVSFVSPRMDSSTQTLLVKAPVPTHGGAFRNDQLVRARVFWAERQAPLIPVTSVTRLGGQFFAFVAEQKDGQTVAHQRSIKVGDLVGDSYVVLDGIKPGDRIIVTGTQTLADGVPVAPQT